MPFRAPIEPSPAPKIRESFHAVAEYLYSLGIKRNNVRMQSYQEFLDAISNGKEHTFNFEESTRLWRDIHELTWVIQVFMDNKLNPPVDLLKKSFDGKALEEYKDESGRNYFLELRAAIYFLRVGYRIDLGTDCDVIAIRNHDRIFIECKRLYSETKARERIRACYQQLEKRLALADRSYKNLGLAWVDPSAAMQKHFFVYAAYSQAGIRHAARNDLIFFWRQWISKAYDGHEKRIFALILQMVSPSSTGASGIHTCFTSYVIPGHAKTSFGGIFKMRKLLDEIIFIEDGIDNNYY